MSLLHDAVLRHHAQQHDPSKPRGPRSSSSAGSPPTSDVESDYSQPSDHERDRDRDIDTDLIPVRTVPSTPALGSLAPSRAGSRATSPTRAAARSARRQERETARIMCGENGTKTRDPLRRLPNEVSLRIFEIFVREDAGDDGDRRRAFLKLHRVSRRWRNSQTINYIWFHMFRFATLTHTSSTPDDPNAIVTDLSTSTRYLDEFRLPDRTTQTWTRREAGTNWARRYRSVYRRDDLEGPVDWREAQTQKARSEGWKTPQEERESRWAEEQAETDGVTKSKKEQRSFYKSLANSKVKGKKSRTSKDKSGLDGANGADPWEAPW